MKAFSVHILKIICVLPLMAPLAAGAVSPRVLEESARIAPPSPAFPLNGPVALHGDYLIAGSTTGVPNGFDEYVHRAFLFALSPVTGEWVYAGQLFQSSSLEYPDQAHFSIDLDDNLAAIAVHDEVVVFERTASGWGIAATLAKPASAYDFGSDVAVSNGVVVVGGLPGDLAAYVYEKNAAGQWVVTGELLAGPSLNDDSSIGPSVAIEINDEMETVLVGSPYAIPGMADPAQIYVYRRLADGTWSLREQLEAGPEGRAAFELESLGTRAVVNDGTPGGFRVFDEMEPDGWYLFDEVHPPEAPMLSSSRWMSLDAVLTASGAVVAVGAPTHDRGEQSGSVTVYAGVDPEAPLAARFKLLASDATPGMYLGRGVSLDGRTVAASSDDGLYIFELPQSSSQMEFQQHDFENGSASGWQPVTSSWIVTPHAGSKVYRQNGTSGDALSIQPNLDLTNQAIQADMRALSFNGANRWMGLLTRYTNDYNNYYVTLRSSQQIELGKRVDNSFTTLATAALPVATNRTYRVRFEAIGTWLRVFVDGALVLQAQDDSLSHGTVALRTSHTRAQYDNIIVSETAQITAFENDFEGLSIGMTTSPEENWSIVSSGGGGVLRQAVAAGPARAIAGIDYRFDFDEPRNYSIEARARPLSFISGQDPWFGLIVRYLNDTNYTYITVNRNGYISLRKLVNGAIHVLDTAPMTVTTGTWHQFQLEAIGFHKRVYVNRTLVLEAVDMEDTDARGKYGFMTSRAATEFDDVRVTHY